MSRKLNVSVLALMGLLGAAGAFAQVLESVEPDNYAAGTVLNNVSSNVSLITADNSNQPHKPAPFDITSEVVSIGPASTGSLVFAHARVGYFYTDRRFRMNFVRPVAAIRLDFIAGNSPSIGLMSYYNQSGALLGTYSTGLISTNVIHTLRVDRTSPDIAWAVAYTAPDSPNQFGKLDNLRFSSDTAPSTNVILTLEKSSGLTNSWATTPITTNMITPEGELNVGVLTNTNGFYRLKIRAGVQ